jgi:hypothetical protein
LDEKDHNIGFQGKTPMFSPKIDENREKIDKCFRRKSAKIGENRRKLAKIGENQRKSAKIGENRRKSAKISENRRKSAKIGENRRKSAKIAKNSNHNFCSFVVALSFSAILKSAILK